MLTAKGAPAILWQLLGSFERGVPGWEHSLLVWRASAEDLAPNCALRANLCARQGPGGLEVRAVVSIQHPDTRSTPQIRRLVAAVTKRLRERGYGIVSDPLPAQPLLAARNVPIRELRGEHLLLSDLAGKTVSPLPRRITTTLAASKAIAAASGWTLHEAGWTQDRKIRVCGVEANALTTAWVGPPGTTRFMVSVEIWLPWSRRGRPPGWLGVARASLARQLRAGGLRVRRLPSEPSLVLASKAPPPGARGLMHLARKVGALRLGDEGEVQARPGRARRTT
jgi:hypothetical protein